MLFDDVTQSRLSMELNFAFRHGVRVELVSAFIDEWGGYALISPQLAAKQYDFRREEWLADFQRRASEMGPEARRFYDELDELDDEPDPIQQEPIARSTTDNDGWS